MPIANKRFLVLDWLFSQLAPSDDEAQEILNVHGAHETSVEVAEWLSLLLQRKISSSYLLQGQSHLKKRKNACRPREDHQRTSHAIKKDLA